MFKSILHRFWGLFNIKCITTLCTEFLTSHTKPRFVCSKLILRLLLRPGNSAKCFWEPGHFRRNVSAKRGIILH